MPATTVFRNAVPGDALTLSTLAMQVFLDTYALNGIDGDLAKEAHTHFAPAVFEDRLRQPGVEIIVATRGEFLVAFLDLDSTTRCPVTSIHGLEVFRLYVQAPFQRGGVGKHLMQRAQRKAQQCGAQHLWLTAWSGNSRALAFYGALGYRDIGVTAYAIEGKSCENRVLAMRVDGSAA